MDSAISPNPSDTSTSSSTLYTDSYARLPSRGATTHAHIIDVCDYHANGVTGLLRLQDVAATTLYNVSADMLETFLSPTVNTFKAVFGEKDMQLVVWRKGLEVLGTASNAYCTSKWADVWAGKFEDRGGVTKMSVEVGDMDMARRASMLAEYMLETRFWELKVDVKTT